VLSSIQRIAQALKRTSHRTEEDMDLVSQAFESIDHYHVLEVIIGANRVVIHVPMLEVMSVFSTHPYYITKQQPGISQVKNVQI
jgi:hypothetical protein